jgi:predicted PurR-regulated permease PerM
MEVWLVSIVSSNSLRKAWKYIFLGFIIASLLILPVILHEIESLRGETQTLVRDLEWWKKRTQALEHLIKSIQDELDSLRSEESINMMANFEFHLV